jgi:hypothetical protein
MAPFAGKLVKAVAFAVSAPSTSTTDHVAREHGRQYQPQQRQLEHQERQLEQRHPRHDDDDVVDLSAMCTSFGIDVPGGGSTGLYLRGRGITGRRGLRVKNAVRDGDVVLSMPLSSCLRDDEPPFWYRGDVGDDDDIDDDVDDGPMGWSTRLAALVLDVIDPTHRAPTDRAMGMEMGMGMGGEGGRTDGDDGGGWEAWRTTLPDPNDLRASLPVHWDERIASHARSTSLEVAIDEMYFARANAVSRLLVGRDRREHRDTAGMSKTDASSSSTATTTGGGNRDGISMMMSSDSMEFRRKCHDALDIVSSLRFHFNMMHPYVPY